VVFARRWQGVIFLVEAKTEDEARAIMEMRNPDDFTARFDRAARTLESRSDVDPGGECKNLMSEILQKLRTVPRPPESEAPRTEKKLKKKKSIKQKKRKGNPLWRKGYLARASLNLRITLAFERPCGRIDSGDTALWLR